MAKRSRVDWEVRRLGVIAEETVVVAIDLVETDPFVGGCDREYCRRWCRVFVVDFWENEELTEEDEWDDVDERDLVLSVGGGGQSG